MAERYHRLPHLGELPPAAQAYLRRVEELAGAPLRYVGVGPARWDTVAL